jgi:hypothetical protein
MDDHVVEVEVSGGAVPLPTIGMLWTAYGEAAFRLSSRMFRMFESGPTALGWKFSQMLQEAFG